MQQQPYLLTLSRMQRGMDVSPTVSLGFQVTFTPSGTATWTSTFALCSGTFLKTRYLRSLIPYS